MRTRSIFALVLLILSIAFLQSCVTGLKVYAGADLAPSQGYVALRFYDISVSGREHSAYTARFVNLDTKKMYTFNFVNSEKISLLALPPGTYRLKNIEVLNTEESPNSTITDTEYMRPPSEIEREFSIEPDRIVYIGECHVYRKKISIFVFGIRVDGAYDFQTAEQEIRARYMNAGDFEIIGE